MPSPKSDLCNFLRPIRGPKHFRRRVGADSLLQGQSERGRL